MKKEIRWGLVLGTAAMLGLVLIGGLAATIRPMGGGHIRTFMESVDEAAARAAIGASGSQSGSFTNAVIVGGTQTLLTNLDVTASRALVSAADKTLASSAVTSTELGYVSGVTSAIQTQMDAKAAHTAGTLTNPTITGGTQSGTTNSSLTASRALVSAADKTLASSAVTSTELGYVSGVTSAIQTQLGNKLEAADIAGKVDETSGTATNLAVNGLSVSGALTNTLATASRALVTDAAQRMTNSAVTSTELGYVSGVTSAIQTQLGNKLEAADIAGKVDETSGTATNLTVNGLSVSGALTNTLATASRALVTDAAQRMTNSAVTSTELGYVSGVTSAIQTQIGTKITAPADPNDDRILFWDDTAGSFQLLDPGTSLTITDTTIDLSAPGVVSGTYGSGTQVGQFYVNSYGVLTNAGNVAIAGLDASVISTGDIPPARGGTGVGTLSGYVYGNGTSDMTASTTIPNTAITGLGTMSTQASDNVAITGGSIAGVKWVVTVENIGNGTNTLAATASGELVTNSAATALAVAVLPNATAGMVFTFRVTDADGIQVKAFTGETIAIGNTTSAAEGYWQSTTIGDRITLVAATAATWVDVASYGQWTVGP